MSSRFPGASRSRSARRWSVASALRDRPAWMSLAFKPASTRSPTSSSDAGSPRPGPSGFPPVGDGLRELGSEQQDLAAVVSPDQDYQDGAGGSVERASVYAHDIKPDRIFPELKQSRRGAGPD